MRQIRVAVLAMALLVMFGCASQNTPTPQPAPMPFVPRQHSMKGWELYSWRDEDRDWHFALVEGTNRNKTAAEIMQGSGDGRVTGTFGIKAELARLPEGEQVFWGTRGLSGFQFPPQSTIDEIRDYCARSGIQLTIF